MQKVTIYSTSSCGYCRSAKRYFQERDIPFEEIDLTGNRAERDALRARSGRHTVPQIYIGETHVGGYDDLCELDEEGGVAPLLSAR